MSARDELADILMSDAVLKCDATGQGIALVEADAILAAGYYKPRTITTVEELDALPEGSTVIGSWAVYQRALGDWVTVGGPSTVTPILPAQVIWEPRS